jgi:hypothetical protein
MRIDADQYGSDSLRNVLGSLTGPLASGASATPLAATAQGRLTVDWSARRPLVVVSLAKSLDAETLTVGGTARSGQTTTALTQATFAAYSERGAALALYVPALSARASTAQPFTVTLTVTSQPHGKPAQPVTGANIAKYVAFEVLEGNMGKLVFLLSQEKARIRRQGRQLGAARLLSTCGLDALDRIGADLGVPRFHDDLVYDRDHHELKTVTLTDAAGNPAAESDDDYARRLGIYRGFLLSSPQRMLDALNGPGADTDPNAGLISGLGVTARFTVSDNNNPFAIAIRIVAVGPDNPRTNFFKYLRSDVLTWLADSADANQAHAARYLPPDTQAQIAALRTRLRGFYDFPPDAAVAPALAEALDRLGRMMQALGHAVKLTIKRAQDPTAGSRYELGLGLDIAALPAADLDALVGAVNNTSRATTPDNEAEALIAAARHGPPASSTADPDGAWLLSTCGLQTVHRLDASTLYVSHAPILGLVVDGPTTVPATGSADYDAHFFPPEDVAINAAVLAGLDGAAARWAAAGHTAWTRLTPAQQSTAWSQAIALAPNASAIETFTAAGLPAIPQPAPVVAGLGHVPADMVATISLDSTLASQILAGNPAAVPALQNLVAILKDSGLASAVALVTGTNAVIVVVSALGLPQIGVNLAERRSSGFRWYTVPLGGAGGVKGFGSSTTLQATAPGALALVCLGYVRLGLTDPYELAIGLPDQATLTPKQYEFLMNTLQHIYPVGIEINTYTIRQKHVDLDGDGHAEPLTASVSKTYRSFVRTRLRGIYQQNT